jgi:hypothetical protein
VTQEAVEITASQVQDLGADFEISTDAPSGARFGDTPLADFRATGAGWYVKGGMSRAQKPWQRVYLKAIDVGVLELMPDSEPYDFPTAEISIFYSDPKKRPERAAGQGTNEWEILSESLRNLYGDKVPTDEKGNPISLITACFGPRLMGENDPSEANGAVFRMKRVPSLLNVPPNDSNPKYHDEMALAWQVVEIEGVGSLMVDANAENGTGPGAGTILEKVFTLMEGKKAAQFYEAALDDAEVMTNAGLVTQLTERTFLSQMKSLGMITEDDEGVLHKKG